MGMRSGTLALSDRGSVCSVVLNCVSSVVLLLVLVPVEGARE